MHLSHSEIHSAQTFSSAVKLLISAEKPYFFRERVIISARSGSNCRQLLAERVTEGVENDRVGYTLERAWKLAFLRAFATLQHTAFLNCSLTRRAGTWHRLLACLTSFQGPRPTLVKHSHQQRCSQFFFLALANLEGTPLPYPFASSYFLSRTCYKVISRVIPPATTRLRYVVNVPLDLQLQLHFAVLFLFFETSAHDRSSLEGLSDGLLHPWTSVLSLLIEV